MISKHYQVPLKESQTLYLIPIGDVHYNTDACDKERFHRLIEWCVQRKKEGHLVRLIGMGDYNDPFSATERAALAGAKGGQGFHDTTYEQFDKWAVALLEEWLSVTKPIHEDFLGLTRGHHFVRFYDRKKYHYVNGDEYLADRMDCDYYGVTGLITLEFPHNQKLVIAAHHGYGGGRTPGYLITKRMNMVRVFPSAHLYLMGHDHHKIVYPGTGLVADPGSPDGLSAYKHYLIGTGSFLKGYITGSPEGGYVEEALLAPADLGVVIIAVRLEQKRKGKWSLDYHPSI